MIKYLKLIALILTVSCNSSSENPATSKVLPLVFDPTVTLISDEVDTDPYAQFEITGIASDHTIELFLNSSCSGQPIASKVSPGPSLKITSSHLDVGTHTFFIRASLDQLTSPCIATAISYTRNLCPDNYLQVNANPEVGTTEDFCVMKYEAKKVLNTEGSVQHIEPVSQATDSPWTTIPITEAAMACRNLNKDPFTLEGYDLISNAEWMTIAREIESVDVNWSDGVVDEGHLNRGWSALVGADGFSNTAPAPTTDENCVYNTAANTCSNVGLHKFKRTHTLKSGQEIWDFAGNVHEWVSWSITSFDLAFGVFPGSACSTAPSEISVMLAACPQFSANQFAPKSSLLTLANGSGATRGGPATDNAMMRGGSYSAGTNGGIYQVTPNPRSSSVDWAGFRCVYRPPVP